MRLKYTDTPTTDPFTADFDSDATNNWDELLQGTDPLVLNATGLVMPDDWQIQYFGAVDVVQATGIDSANGVTYLQDYLQGRTPNKGAVSDTGGTAVTLEVFTPLL